MAKKTVSTQPEPGSVEERVIKFAEQVGWIAGFAKAKTDEMFDRTRITAQLAVIRDEASALLAHLQTESAPPEAPAAPPMSPARAPGKRHRAPLPRGRGVKHSRQEIAKAKMASTLRKRARG